MLKSRGDAEIGQVKRKWAGREGGREWRGSLERQQGGGGCDVERHEGERRRERCSVSRKVSGDEKFKSRTGDGGWMDRWRGKGNTLQNGRRVEPGQPY